MYWDHKVDPERFEYYSSVPYSEDWEDDERILWLSLPRGKTNFPTVVWFHGGGMTQDHHECPQEIHDASDYAVVEPRYRLAPKHQAPAFIEDASASLAWTLKHIEQFGGDPKRVFVGGMSAGAYLAMLTALDPRWLAAHGLNHRDLAGILSLSGQVSTHFLVAEHLNLPALSAYAPLTHISAEQPPTLLVVGDPMCDIEGRSEENVHMAAELRKLGHPIVECHALGGQDHPGAFVHGAQLVVPFLERCLGEVRM